MNVLQLFEHADVAYGGVVPWGGRVPLSGPGIYVVSTAADPTTADGLPDCPVDESAVSALLIARPEATVDGAAATVESLTSRLAAMWPARETVAYVGLASRSVGTRMAQFYRTEYGARGPHAGGWPVKMLAPPDGMWVHFGATGEYAHAEMAMLDVFMAQLTPDVRGALVDPALPLPFANLMHPGGRRKAHGVGRVKAGRGASPGGGGRRVG
ncbi:hypothetical protein AB0N73_16315 [Microbacterium sp. NPDC089189]|uniref:hypothetical protein n=1 Tax=Microbacterium sp. NPDC089189 TaxID=3154972 RepID=UPI00343848AE